VQLLTDTNHGFVVNVAATTDTTDGHQLEPALKRCQATLGSLPQQLMAYGDHTNDASVRAAAASGVDFYGSWPEIWRPVERDSQGRSLAFLGVAFPYDEERDLALEHVSASRSVHYEFDKEVIPTSRTLF
jgi:hypothetical protein